MRRTRVTGYPRHGYAGYGTGSVLRGRRTARAAVTDPTWTGSIVTVCV